MPALIVARNNLALTKKAVASTGLITGHVLVVDNCSSDGTTQWLRSKDITTICLSKQRSLAACWNTGLAAMWMAGYSQCLVMNNDVQIRGDTYFRLTEMNLPFVSCVSVNDWDQVGLSLDRSIEQLHESMRPHPDFSCFMIKESVTDKVGWFDEDYYPAYVEDCDYHVRMHRAGIEAVCVDLPFYHASAQTLKQADEKEKLIIQRGADANRERFRQKYGCLPGTPEYQKLFEPITLDR